MAGFTLYETLRIFVPGALGVLVANLVVRLALGPDPLAAEEATLELIDGLQHPVVFAALALLLGLVLYQVDLPLKLRLSSGDPARGWRLPSNVLHAHVKGSGLEQRSLGLYFLLSDRYLPAEMHRRVYLFGSLYRVFADLRILLALGAVAGPAIGLLEARRLGLTPFPPFSLKTCGVVAVSLLLLGAVAAIGIRSHAVNFLKKHRDRTYRRELQEEMKGIWRAAGLTALFGFVAMLVLAFSPLSVIGGVLGAAALVLWFSIEIGPPDGSVAEARQFSWRSYLLHRLRATYEDRVQYAPTQRLACDLALFLPSLVAASIATATQGRPPAAVAIWLVLMAPCVLIMAIRKHEVRLLNVYEDQSVWLDLHERDLERLKRNYALPDRWGDD